jgi:hypothetical protein
MITFVEAYDICPKQQGEDCGFRGGIGRAADSIIRTSRIDVSMPIMDSGRN